MHQKSNQKGGAEYPYLIFMPSKKMLNFIRCRHTILLLKSILHTTGIGKSPADYERYYSYDYTSHFDIRTDLRYNPV